MWFGLQIVLAAAGVLFVLFGKIPVGGRTIRNPIASLVGMVLASALPLSVLLVFAIGFREMILQPVEGRPEDAYSLVLENYWWLQPSILFGSLGLALGLGWIGLQQEEELPPLVNETINPEAMRQRAAEVVSQHSERLSREPIWSRIPTDEELPPEVKTYTAPPDQVPDEIAALGQADCVFAARETGWWGGKPTSYALFRQGLVVLQGDDFTLVPFSAMTTLEGDRLHLVDGSTRQLQANVEHRAHLLQLIQQRLVGRATAEV
jgi:hypothetical protein